MKTTNKRELNKIFKSLGLKISTSTSSRISGWGNQSEGVKFGEVYPFKGKFQKGKRYHYWYSKDATHEMKISYAWSSYKWNMTNKERAQITEREATTMKEIEKALDENGITNRSSGEDTLEVYIANPNYGTAYTCPCGTTH